MDLNIKNYSTYSKGAYSNTTLYPITKYSVKVNYRYLSPLSILTGSYIYI